YTLTGNKKLENKKRRVSWSVVVEARHPVGSGSAKQDHWLYTVNRFYTQIETLSTGRGYLVRKERCASRSNSGQILTLTSSQSRYP
ncbi:hypothetical protein K0M31_005715, partial [Melipona bicolor]